MLCDACENGEHWNCGMQTWCECDCDGPGGMYGYEDDPMPPAKADEDIDYEDHC